MEHTAKHVMKEEHASCCGLSITKQQDQAAAAAHAKATVATFAAVVGRGSVPTADDVHTCRSDIGLPLDVLEFVMYKLAKPDRVHGPSVICQDIMNARMACWQLNRAATHALTYLNSLLPLPAADSVNISWDAVIQNPMSLTVHELKQAARKLGLPVGGTKAELIIRNLKAFGLQQPTAWPASLCMALHKEPSDQLDVQTMALVKDLARAGHPVADRALRQTNVVVVRQELNKLVHSYDELIALHRSCIINRTKQLSCIYCGTQAAARQCQKRMCATCCKLWQQQQDGTKHVCERHPVSRAF